MKELKKKKNQKYLAILLNTNSITSLNKKGTEIQFICANTFRVFRS